MSGDDLVTALAERLQAVVDDATYADNYKVVVGERLADVALAFVAEHANRCGLHPQNTASNCVMCIAEGQALIHKQYVERLPTREEIVKALSVEYGRLPDGSAYPSVERMADAFLRDLRGRLGI